MPNYVRWYVPDSTVFLTWVTYNRTPLFNDPGHVERLRRAIRQVQGEWPFEFAAAVVLPDHVHFLWTMPHNDPDYSKRIGRVKTRFTKLLPIGDQLRGSPNESRIGHRESGVWQRRFWEHTIRDEDDFKAHLDYIHYNPVKHGYVERALDWKYTSFNKWVELGEYESLWGTGAIDTTRMSEIALSVGE